MAEVRWRRAECDGGGRGARWEATCKAWHASPWPVERRRVLRAWRGSSLVHAGRLDVLVAAGALFGFHPDGRHDGRRLRAPAGGAMTGACLGRHGGRRLGARAGRRPTGHI